MSVAAILPLFVFLVSFVPFSVTRGPCDPLVPEYCSLPFPNSFYTVEDPSTVTGRSLSFSSKSLPNDIFGRGIQPSEWNTLDGFPSFPSILTYFNDIDDSNLPPHWNIANSLTWRSPTVLYNLLTGNMVPHFSELDSSFKISNRRALMIWPAVRLNDSSHYLVAIKNLKHLNGSDIAPSKAFEALRDSIITNNTDIEFRRAQYDQYFNVLIKSGIISNRNELQLLWDFHTASKECISRRLLFMRDDSSNRVGSGGPPYSLLNITHNYTANIYSRIQGEMSIPLYLKSPLPGSHLVINDKGLPVYQRNFPARFTILIPQSLANGSIETASIVQYGHGLFSTQDEVTTGYLQEQANRYGYILAACDQWGMSEIDLPSIVSMLALNVSNFRIVPDRLSQGIINELLLMKLLKGTLHKDPTITLGGMFVVDPDEVFYYGVSLGGIIGHVYMAVTTDVTRGVLGVPGGPFGLLLPRSSDFKQFEDGSRILYPDTVDYMIVLSLFNMLWARCGPGGYMSYIGSPTLPNTPSHRVIYQYGLGDAQVNILALYSSGRSNKAKMFSSNVRETFDEGSNRVIKEKLFGFDFTADNTVLKDGSLAMGYDCHAPPEPMGNVPPSGATDTHELPRRTKSAQEQMYLFFKKGEIHNTCNGPCINECHV